MTGIPMVSKYCLDRIRSIRTVYPSFATRARHLRPFSASTIWQFSEFFTIQNQISKEIHMLQTIIRQNGARYGVRWLVVCSLCAMLVVFYGVQNVRGQTFSSGSTGADGPLSYTTPGTYIFDPKALNIDPEGDNVFNFTTI